MSSPPALLSALQRRPGADRICKQERTMRNRAGVSYPTGFAALCRRSVTCLRDAMTQDQRWQCRASNFATAASPAAAIFLQLRARKGNGNGALSSKNGQGRTWQYNPRFTDEKDCSTPCLHRLRRRIHVRPEEAPTMIINLQECKPPKADTYLAAVQISPVFRDDALVSSIAGYWEEEQQKPLLPKIHMKWRSACGRRGVIGANEMQYQTRAILTRQVVYRGYAATRYAPLASGKQAHWTSDRFRRHRSLSLITVV
ncbi:hypothetical protein DFH06DRAFT_1128840 [Mycena polygramma]|nr:hypothetical protein DFH06DRAFT_1128840 [Mycena polygramma]